MRMTTELIYKDEVYAIQGAVFEVYKGEAIEKTYVPDLWCYDAIIVELKAVNELSREHEAQLANYLHLTKCPLGLLVNFGSFPKATVRRWHRKDTP